MIYVVVKKMNDKTISDNNYYKINQTENLEFLLVRFEKLQFGIVQY